MVTFKGAVVQQTDIANMTLRVVVVLALCACAVRGDRYHGEDVGAKGAAANARQRPAPLEAERTKQFWYDEAQAAIEKRARRSSGQGKAKNIVMFLGDGMSVPTLAAARTLLGQRQGRTGEESELSFESFPSIGLSKVIFYVQFSFVFSFYTP